MANALITHYIHNNMDEIEQNSLKNCHVKGVHSVMLSNTPGKIIRLFYTDTNHELWKNSISSLMEKESSLSVALHPHHCNITLEQVFGSILNIQLKKQDSHCKKIPILLDEYLYTSQIKTGKMGFELSQRNVPFVLEPKNSLYFHSQRHIYLHAEDLHTMFVPMGANAAWLVYEGKENPEYKNVCYSNNDLTQLSSEGLYQKFEKHEIRETLKFFKIIE